MKTLFALLLLIATTAPVSAQYTNGYTRSNGTYVQGYYHTAPDNNPYNNRSYTAPRYTAPPVYSMPAMPQLPQMPSMPRYSAPSNNTYNMPIY